MRWRWAPPWAPRCWPPGNGDGSWWSSATRSGSRAPCGACEGSRNRWWWWRNWKRCASWWAASRTSSTTPSPSPSRPRVRPRAPSTRAAPTSPSKLSTGAPGASSASSARSIDCAASPWPARAISTPPTWPPCSTSPSRVPSAAHAPGSSSTGPTIPSSSRCAATSRRSPRRSFRWRATRSRPCPPAVPSAPRPAWRARAWCFWR